MDSSKYPLEKKDEENWIKEKNSEFFRDKGNCLFFSLLQITTL